MEKYYAPKFEVYVRMPTFVFNTDKYIEAMVQAVYPWEKTAKGNSQNALHTIVEIIYINF